MWPFDRLRQRKYDRRYKAALIVFLGTHMFECLDVKEKARVESEVNDNFNRTDTPAVAWKRWTERDLVAAFRAAAMDRLGLQPSIPGLSWSQLFEPWRLWRKVPEWPRQAFDSRACVLIYDFHPFDSATADARQFLLQNGVSMLDTDPVET